MNVIISPVLKRIRTVIDKDGNVIKRTSDGKDAPFQADEKENR